MSDRHKAVSRAAATAVAGVAALIAGSQTASAQLRIVQYNTGALKTGQTTVFEQIGNEQVNGIAKPIDVLVVEEQGITTTAQATASLNTIRDALNTIYGSGTYATVAYPGSASSTGGGLPGMIIRQAGVDVIGNAAAVGTVGGDPLQPRSTIRYQLRPDGYDSAADFYVYASHMKATDDAEGRRRRESEVAAIRTNADALPNAHHIYMGDFNFYRSTDDAYEDFLADTNGGAADSAAVDPLGTADWEGSDLAQKLKHTQSPVDANDRFYGGQIGGGVDDRFDFQLSTSEVQDGQGFTLMPNSYHVFGNNGSHVYSNDIDESNTWNPPGLTVSAATALNALAMATDHLPVVADYKIPVKMSVSVTPSVPAKIITGTVVQLNAAVSNVAPVTFAAGSETLSYSGSITGDVSGTASGTRAPLTSANNHTLTLNTATAGNKSGTIGVTTANQGAAGATYNQNVNFQVLDHSNASFDTGSDVNSQTVNFGYVPQGFATRFSGFTIATLTATPGFTARLDLTLGTTTGDTGILTHNVSPFSNRNAGSSTGYSTTLTTSTAGNLSASYTFNVADEAGITGGGPGTSLVLTSNARVISSATFNFTDFIQLNTGETYNTGPFAIGNGVTLTKTGVGTLNINNAQINASNSALVASAGVVTVGTDSGTDLALAASGSTVNLNATQHLRALSVTAGQVNASANIVTNQFTQTGGKLDLKNNKLIVHNGDTAAIRGNVATGRNNGNWNGNGIITSESNAALANQITTLAVAAASDVLGVTGSNTTTWAGEAVAGVDTLVKYTWNGDANLSGTVDADDYFQIDAHYGDASTSFYEGDFNYDNIVNGDDYVLIDLGFSGQTGVIGGLGAGVTSVPEPVFASVLGFALLGLRRHRRPTR